MKTLRYRYLVGIVVALINGTSLQSWAAEKGITFQAVLKDQAGAVISAPSGLPVRAQILSPNNCVLREELFSSVAVSAGYLNLNLLNGVAQSSGMGGKDPGLTTDQVFDNSDPRSSLVCVNSDGSVNGGVTSFNPATHGHARKLRLLVDLNSVVPGESLLVNFNIRSSAFAARADTADNAVKLNSKSSSDFVNINSGSGVTQSNVESIFSNYARLNSLLSVNLDGSGNYTGNITGNAATATVAGNVTGTVSVANGGTGATTLSANSVLLGNGTSAVQAVAPGTSGNVLTSNGTTWVSSPASGTVTSVASKTGAVTLVAADITDFSTAADSRADARIAAVKGANNGLASLDGSGKVPSSQLALSASDIPNLDAAKITTGTITNNVSATSVSGTSGQFTNLRVYDGSANYLTQKAPSGGFAASGYSIEWPAAVGSPSDVLRINAVTGSVATLEWAAPAGGGTVTSVATGTGLSGGPITGSGTIAVDVGTTANKIVQLNGSAQLPAVDGSLLTNLPSPANFSGSLAGDVSGTQGATSVDKIKGTAVSNTGLASGKYLKFDGTNWVPAIVGINDLVSSVTTNQQFTTSSCSASQTLNWSSLTDSFGCVSIAITESNISGSIARSKLAAGLANRLIVNDGSGAVVDAAAITASRALVSDTNGIPLASTVTAAELAHVSGVTSAIQTQIDNKQASLGFTPVDKAGDTMTGVLNLTSNGLIVGTNQLVVSGGSIGVGTASPGAKLDVRSPATYSSATTLSSGITSGVTSLTVASTAGYPSSGVIAVDGELMLYTGTTGTTFTGLTRGASGTTAAAHSAGAYVEVLSLYAPGGVRAGILTATEFRVGSAAPATVIDSSGAVLPGTTAAAEGDTCTTGGAIVRDAAGNVMVCAD